MAYDFTDQQVLGLVQAMHTPTEVSDPAVDQTRFGQPIELFLVCAADHSPWPCPAVVGLRSFLVTNPQRVGDRVPAGVVGVLPPGERSSVR